MSAPSPTLTALKSVRPGPVFLGLVVLAVGTGYWLWTTGAERSPSAEFSALLLVLAGWVISLCLHEFAHAFTAFRYGDRNTEMRGYLTLNPLKYTHPGLSLGLPLLIIMIGGIGFPGGAVYLNTSGFTKRQRTLVALAGPITNVVLGAILLLIVQAVELTPQNVNLMGALTMLGFLQFTAAILNLIPMPGFDGYNAIEPYLSHQTRQSAAQLAPWGFVLIIVLLLIPPINRAFFGLIDAIVEAFGVPSVLVDYGWQLAIFWL